MHSPVHPAIRSLRQQDLAILADQYFPWSTREETFEKWSSYLKEQQQGLRFSCIIESQNKIAGYGNLLPFSHYAAFREKNIPEINDLWIYDQYRKKGFGTLLITHLEDLAKQQGYQQMGIGVGLYRDYGSAQKLYVQLGYQPEGKGVTYKGEPVTPGENYPLDDDLILWLVKSFGGN